MKIAILQPTPFKKGHYFIYTKSLLDNLRKRKYFVKVISSMKIFNKFDSENISKIDFNIYSFRGLIIYISLCYLAIFRLIILRNNFNKIIILDCEYSSLSILFFVLYLLGWEGKITVQVNAPNFNYSFKDDGLNFFRILKFIQSYIFKYSLNLLPIKISCLGIWHKRKLTKQLSFDKNKIFVIEDGGGGFIQKIPKNILTMKLKSSDINFPKGNKAIDQLFKLALTFMNLGKNEVACAAFSKLESEFPNAPKRISNRAKEYIKRAKC